MDLKKIFKRIHPDLFHDNQLQRSTNEKSFQYLSQFLDGNQTEDRTLHFYFYDDSQILKDIEVEFKAPPAYAASGVLKNHIIRHLKILTLAIELDLQDVFGAGYAEAAATTKSKSEIIDFLKNNLADAKRKSDDYNRQNELIKNLKNKLERLAACKVMVSGSLSYSACKDMLESLCKHAAKIKKFKFKDQYLYIVDDGFFHEAELSLKDDTIKIPVSVQVEDVLIFLEENHNKARAEAREHKKRKEYIENLQRKLRRQLKLDYLSQSVFCADDDYLSTLQTIEKFSTELKNLKIKGLRVVVADKSSIEESGTLYIAGDIEPADLIAFVSANVEQAHILRRQEAVYDSEIKKLENTIKKKLPFYLYSSYNISKPNYIYALHNIIKAIPLLKDLDFENNGICISTEFEVSSLGTIRIPYNFSVEDLREFLPKNDNLKRLR